MTLFLGLKVVHVLSVITAVGSNLTYAFWMRQAPRDRQRLAYTIEALRRLDRTVANPAYGVAFLTGLAMVTTGAYSFETPWIVAVLGIVLFAPAIRRQLAEAERDPAGAAYAAAASRSNRLGIVTTAIVLVIVALMITKPG